MHDKIEQVKQLLKESEDSPLYFTFLAALLLRTGASLEECSRYFCSLSRSDEVVISWKYLYQCRENWLPTLPEKNLIEEYQTQILSCDRFHEPISLLGNLMWIFVIIHCPKNNESIQILLERTKTALIRR